jgi:hypothetical protein
MTIYLKEGFACVLTWLLLSLPMVGWKAKEVLEKCHSKTLTFPETRGICLSKTVIN